MIKDFADIMLSVYDICLYGGVGATVLLFRQSNSYLKWLTVYLVIMLFVELSGEIIGGIFGSNHIIMPLMSIAELIFFLLFYREYYLQKQFSHFKKAGAIAIIFILAELIWNFVLNVPDPKTFQPYSKVVDNAVVIAMALTSLYNAIAQQEQNQRGGIMFNLVMLMFFTFNTMFFLPFNFLVNAPMESKFVFWACHTISLVLFYTYIEVRVVSYAISKYIAKRA